MSEKDVIIEMHGIKKSFGGVQALRHIDLQVRRGTCHALVGENGAGKSTLMKVLTGIISKDEGQILLNGQEYKASSLREAEKMGIAIVPQELSFVSYFSVAENIFYGEEPSRKLPILVDWKKLYSACDQKLEELKISLPSRALASSLNVSDQQMMVIARVLAKNADVIIMDEPTARLGHGEVEKLLNYIEYLKTCGKTIIYISHRLEEIFQVCDHITVMRDGQTVHSAPTAELDNDRLINLMVNRQMKVDVSAVRNSVIGEEMLSVSHLHKEGVLKDVSFTVHKGEILGMFGLVGAGRTEAIRAVLGVDKYDGAEIRMEGKPVVFNHIGQALEAGIALVPEERRKQGILPNTAIGENVSIGYLKAFSRFGIINKKKEKEYAERVTNMLNVACASIQQTVGSLSGGNQQKVVIAKYIDRSIKVLIMDEPTRGIDVGAKDQIYEIIQDLAKQGMAVIVISSEIPELQLMCDRICVMSQGQVTAVIDRKEFADSDNILRNAIGI
ncbi:MAG: sugar ABC transporter ATP-binding protein [Oscillibacter sp.]|nr:sugar ABC transporter ATP-binding protein [Oscillibacter sp.]